MSHWACKYIGKAYETGGRGPDAYDCWGLVRAVYANEFQIELPEFPGLTLTSETTQVRALYNCLYNDWRQLEKPEDGCGVAMSQKNLFHHVGIWVVADGGKILHAWKDAGVIASTEKEMQTMRGFRKIKFHRHSLWLT